MQAAYAKLSFVIATLIALPSPAVLAKLPPPTPEQQQAAAAKKEAAAAQAAKEKQELAASMQRVADRWRSRAAAHGWDINPATPIAAPEGFKASETQSSASGQPGGKLGAAAADAPVRSEKAGTAPASADVKDPAKKGK